jgi:hypothetical protein
MASTTNLETRGSDGTVLTPVEEAMIVAFRRGTPPPLDDVMGCLRGSIPKLWGYGQQSGAWLQGRIAASAQRVFDEPANTASYVILDPAAKRGAVVDGFG